MSQYGRNVLRKKLTTAQFQACFRFILILVVEDHITDLVGCKILILLTCELFNQKLSQNQLPSLVLSFSSRSIWKQDCCGHFIIITYTWPPAALDISPWCWEEHCQCISSDASWHLVGLVTLSASKNTLLSIIFFLVD